MTERTETFRPDVTLVRNDAKHRYELHVAGELASYSQYIDKPGHIDFIHTVTEDKFTGQGLAQVLVHYALDDVVASGKRIISHCPYITEYLSRHPQYELCIDSPS